MKKINTKSFTMIILVLVIAGLGFYTYLINQTKKQQKTVYKTEAQQLLEYDFEENYPKTVRETVRLHCKYLKNVYNRKFGKEDLSVVNSNIRKLFDEELLTYNPEEQQLQELKKDIALYKEKKQKFVSYSLEESSQVEYNTEEEKEYAKITATLNITVDSVAVFVEQEYLLRKDESGRWKILGWQSVKPDVDENKGDVE